MEKLLYESKGAPTVGIVCMAIGGVMLSILGAIAMFIANMKRKGISISIDGQSGTIGGGGYLIKEDERTTMIVVGICLIVIGILLLISLLSLPGTVFRIYEQHIEGVRFLPILGLRSTYFYNFNEIIGCHTSKHAIILHTKMGMKQIALKNAQCANEAFQKLQSMRQEQESKEQQA